MTEVSELDTAFETIVEVFKCANCAKLVEIPISARCGHVFCRKCVYNDGLAKSAMASCFVCNSLIDTNGLIEREDFKKIYKLVHDIYDTLTNSNNNKLKRTIDWLDDCDIPESKILKQVDKNLSEKESHTLIKALNQPIHMDEEHKLWLKSVIKIIDHRDNKDITEKIINQLYNTNNFKHSFPIVLKTTESNNLNSFSDENNELLNQNATFDKKNNDLDIKPPTKFIKCTQRKPLCLPHPDIVGNIDKNSTNLSPLKTSTPIVISRTISQEQSNITNLQSISDGVDLKLPTCNNVDTVTDIIRSNSNYCIVKSRMNKKIYKQILVFCEKFNVKYKEDIDSTVTHVVMHTDDHKVVFRNGYTFKYIMGLASKKMITSHLWIIDSLSSNKLLDPSEYEIVTDGIQVDRYVPRKARLSKDNLFDGYGIIIFGSFEGSYISYENMKTLLSECGACVESLLEMIPFLQENYKTVHVLCYPELDINKKKEAHDVCLKYNVPLLAFDWAVESIVSYVIEPVNNYMIII